MNIKPFNALNAFLNPPSLNVTPAVVSVSSPAQKMKNLVDGVLHGVSERASHLRTSIPYKGIFSSVTAAGLSGCGSGDSDFVLTERMQDALSFGYSAMSLSSIVLGAGILVVGASLLGELKKPDPESSDSDYKKYVFDRVKVGLCVATGLSLLALRLGMFFYGRESLALALDQVPTANGISVMYVDDFLLIQDAQGLLLVDTELHGAIFGTGDFVMTILPSTNAASIGPIHLAQDRVVDGIRYKAGARLFFFENGQISYGTLAQDTNISGIELHSGDMIVFDQEGRLKKVHLTQDTTINGVLYKAGFRISFEDNGVVTASELYSFRLLYHSP